MYLFFFLCIYFFILFIYILFIIIFFFPLYIIIILFLPCSLHSAPSIADELLKNLFHVINRLIMTMDDWFRECGLLHSLDMLGTDIHSPLFLQTHVNARWACPTLCIEWSPACIGKRWAHPTKCVVLSPTCVGRRSGIWRVSLADLQTQTPSTLVVSEACSNL